MLTDADKGGQGTQAGLAGKLSRAKTGTHRAKATFWELVTRKETTRDQGPYH